MKIRYEIQQEVRNTVIQQYKDYGIYLLTSKAIEIACDSLLQKKNNSLRFNEITLDEFKTDRIVIKASKALKDSGLFKMPDIEYLKNRFGKIQRPQMATHSNTQSEMILNKQLFGSIDISRDRYDMSEVPLKKKNSFEYMKIYCKSATEAYKMNDLLTQACVPEANVEVKVTKRRKYYVKIKKIYIKYYFNDKVIHENYSVYLPKRKAAFSFNNRKYKIVSVEHDGERSIAEVNLIKNI